MADIYDEPTERLLPCPNRSCGLREFPRCTPLIDCPAHYRPAVAAALRELGQIRSLLIRSLIKATSATKDDIICAPLTIAINHAKEIAGLRREIERLQKIIDSGEKTGEKFLG